MSDSMSINQKYYTYYINPVTGWCRAFETVWRNDSVDRKRENEGKIFRCMPDAQKAMEQAQKEEKEQEQKSLTHQPTEGD